MNSASEPQELSASHPQEPSRSRREWWRIARIVEARLWEYGLRVQEEPPTPISHVYQAPMPPPKKSYPVPSQAERWLLRREDVLAMARWIAALPYLERRYVELHYVAGLGLHAVCRTLGISRSEARRVRYRVLAILAVQMGLLGAAVAWEGGGRAFGEAE